MKQLKFRTWTIPIALLLFCFFGFGLLIPMVGFYWDDWPTIWQLHMFGPQGFAQAFSVDRPFLAWLFMLTTPILGESTIAWQFFGIFTLWISCLSMWWMLHVLWPQKTAQITWITLLFAVYPSFTQHYIAVTYSHGYLVLSLFFFSMGSMIAALRKPQRARLWTLSSWISATLSLFMTEYFFGLELLRPILMWIALQDAQLDVRQRVRKILRTWVPYLLIMAVFLIWRIVLTDTERGEVQIINQFFTEPLTALLELGRTIFLDIYEVLFLAWGQTVNEANFVGQESYILGAIISMIILPAIAIFIYLYKLKPEDDFYQATASQNQKSWAVQAILIGLFALLIGGWPFWATKLTMMLVFPWDRFTLPMAIGASIFIVGCIDLIFPRNAWKVLVISIMLGLAIGLHFNTGLEYRKLWNKQRKLFQQLSWRAPGIEPGTILMTPILPFVQYSDNSLTAPLNWIYAPDNASTELDYLMLSLETRIGSLLTEFSEDTPVHHRDRNLTFDGTTSKAIVFYYEPPRCLTIVEPGIDKSPPNKDWYYKEAMVLSKPELIIFDPPNPAVPPVHIFGIESEDRWCYYFEKADLARQMGNWSIIPELGDQAYPYIEDLYSVNAPEFIPFIQGYALASDWEKALDWTMIAFDLKPRVRSRLCDTWQGIINNTESNQQRQESVSAVEDQLECSFLESQ